MTEPLTSLLRRECAIAAAGAGKLSRALWEMNRVLQVHLQPDVDCAKTSVNEEGRERKTAETPVDAPLLPFPDPLWDTRSES